MGGGRNTKHHRHSRGYRTRRWLRQKKKYIIVILAAVLIAALCAGVWVNHMQAQKESRHVTSGNGVNMGSGYRNLTEDGRSYQYNSLITTILVAGVDSEGELKASKTYTNAPRADSINLVILDKKHKSCTILALNRDTMTEIRRYTVSGKDRGTYVSHLCLAYTYGEGGEVSCENITEAVSNLLGGIPINEYIVMNRSSMEFINDLVGGVTVTVPNDDLADVDPAFQKGAQVTLDDSNIELYLRQRDTGEDFSNEGRMERQKSYMLAYVDQFRELLETDLNGTWEKLEKIESCVQTSITRNKYLDLADTFSQVSLEEGGYYTPEGQDAQGELHDEFYADEEALHKKVLELFYEEL